MYGHVCDLPWIPERLYDKQMVRGHLSLSKATSTSSVGDPFLWRYRNKLMRALHAKVHSCSVDPQKNCRKYLITCSIFKFPTPHRLLLQRRCFDMHISTVDPMNKKLAVLP